jgi:hypothetical protein
MPTRPSLEDPILARSRAALDEIRREGIDL